MNIFPNDSLHEETIALKGFKFLVPLSFVEPKIVTESTGIYLFLGGLDTTNSQIRLMNHPLFHKHYLVSFERMSSFENKNKAKRWMHCYVAELHQVINYCIAKFGNRKIHLVGESWGGGIAIAYQKKYYDVVTDVCVWNIPNRVKDTSNRGLLQKLSIVPSMFWSILFGIVTYDPHIDIEEIDLLTTNPIISRIKKINAKKYRRNNVTLLAAWWAIKPTWKKIKKTLTVPGYKLFYIQSKDDMMMDKSFFDKVKSIDIHNKISVVNGGYHILSGEEKWSDELFKIIERLTKD